MPAMRFLRLGVFLFIRHLGGAAYASEFSGRVAAVQDGGTLTMLTRENARHRIRLTGMDAPARGQVFGKRSRQHPAEFV